MPDKGTRITLTFSWAQDFRVLRKRLRGETLTAEEEHILRRARRRIGMLEFDEDGNNCLLVFYPPGEGDLFAIYPPGEGDVSPDQGELCISAWAKHYLSAW